MVRGRKPTHPALKILRGNPGKRRVAKDTAPAAGALPPCPPHLQGRAAEAWTHIGGQLVAIGMFAESDGLALAMLCEAWAAYRAAIDAVNAVGSVIVGTAGGKPVLDKRGLPVLARNKYDIAALAWAKEVHRWASELGLTPTARARILGHNLPSGNDNQSEVLRVLDEMQAS